MKRGPFLARSKALGFAARIAASVFGASRRRAFSQSVSFNPLRLHFRRRPKRATAGGATFVNGVSWSLQISQFYLSFAQGGRATRVQRMDTTRAIIDISRHRDVLVSERWLAARAPLPTPELGARAPVTPTPLLRDFRRRLRLRARTGAALLRAPQPSRVGYGPLPRFRPAPAATTPLVARGRGGEPARAQPLSPRIIDRSALLAHPRSIISARGVASVTTSKPSHRGEPPAVELRWRSRAPASVSSAESPVHPAAAANTRSVASGSFARSSSPGAAPVVPVRPTPLRIADLDSNLLERLTDDVIRRVEKRVRIERERAGR